MADSTPRRKRADLGRRNRDWGKSLARLLCVIFALTGAIPLTGGVLLRSEPLQEWAASETSRLLRNQLGLRASFAVELSLIPLRLAVTDLTVLANDSSEPAIVADTIAVNPRFFSLLAGRIDVGDISLEDAEVRLVVVDGKVRNVDYHFPETKKRASLSRAPFRSLAVTNAKVDLLVDGVHVVTGGIDVDAIVENALSFDVALHAGRTTVQAKRTTDEGQTLFDDDQLCELDLRVFLSEEEISIRRLSLLGRLDDDPAEGTFGECEKEDTQKLALRLSQLEIKPKSEGPPHVRGHILSRAPLALFERFVPRLETTGWAAFAGELAFDGSSRIPDVSGQITGADLSISTFAIAKELTADLLISGDVVQIPKMFARWGNGKANFVGVKVEPFEEKVPLSIDHMATEGIDMPGVMRDVGVTDHAWVDWNFGKTEAEQVRGTILPFYIDGAFDGQTKNFAVYDKGFDDPTKKRMVGIARANVRGRFRAHAGALEFYAAQLSFGKSRLPIDLVSVGFRQNPLVVRMEEGGGTLDLKDISPVADLPFSGVSEIFVDMSGPMKHPVLKGTLAVKDLRIAGYDAGDIEKSDVHFEPLFVEFSDLSAQKGAMRYKLPKARLSFDGPAKVEFKGTVNSNHFVLSEFMRAFHFDDDPRFEGLMAKGKVEAQVRYLLGGPEDTCGAGRLSVSGHADLSKARALGEDYEGGAGGFSFEWFDIEAGLRGIRVGVPQLTLRKGTGTIFASVDVEPGGILSGNVVGTRIPVSRVDSLSQVLSQADGFITGAGQLAGTLDNMAFSADVQVSTLKARDVELAPSHLNLRLEPNLKPPRSGTEKTGCGRFVASETPATPSAQSDGTFVVSGRLFGNQIELFDAKITRHAEPVLSGRAVLSDLDLSAVLALSGVDSDESPYTGKLSGDVTVANFSQADPFASSIRLGISEASLSQNGVTVELADKRASLRLLERQLTSRHLSLRAKTNTGQSAIVDAELNLNDQSYLTASFDLRPTDLGVLTSALPGVERAAGELEGSVALEGYWSKPRVTGYFEVRDGEAKLSGFDSPIEDLELQVGMDESGMRVEKGTARWGGGRLSLQGNAPLVQGQLGRTNLGIFARSVQLPLGNDLQAKFNADLNLSIPALSSESEELPLLSGSVDLLSGSYEKQMSMTADIATLTSKGEKTEVTDYDEEKDSLRLDVLLKSREPIKVKNALVKTSLLIDPSGIRVSGTDQRFGAVGSLRIDSGGQVFLRRNEFEIQGGLVRFSDPTQLQPEVDVTAVTEYRRYTDQGATQGSGAGSANSSAGTPLAGNWRILMHAYGPPDNLKVDLASDPPLAQDDIFLLLTVGLTRTELDQSNNSGVGSSVALEALGSLSGAESAVTNAVPVDEFRFGSTYSSRSGRTEPTVTIGKRLSARIRASVTTSLSETSEVRSNVEYRATDNLSVEGSFDNASNVATAAGGNLGGDVRWRLEFR